VGEHPDGGEITLHDGKYGPYVKWGKVNATLPKERGPDDLTLAEAIDLVNAKAPKRKAPARKAGANKAAGAKAEGEAAPAGKARKTPVKTAGAGRATKAPAKGGARKSAAKKAGG